MKNKLPLITVITLFSTITLTMSKLMESCDCGNARNGCTCVIPTFKDSPDHNL